jgi:amidophosphoribosyltransferase
VASESVALDTLGFKLLRDVAPGEAVLVDTAGRFHSRQCAAHGAGALHVRVRLSGAPGFDDGRRVGVRIAHEDGRVPGRQDPRTMPNLQIDVVIPIPDSSRPSAMQLATRLDLPYREGFVKNRYIGRTFIMPGQARAEIGAPEAQRHHPGVQGQERAAGRRLHRARHHQQGDRQMAREAGATKVYFASAAPPVRYANVYGIDMPTRGELIASDRTDEEIAARSAPTA